MRLSHTLFAMMIVIMEASPAVALDLNVFRAQHGRPALSSSVTLAGMAYAHANDMAVRNHLDHNNFRQRIGAIGTAHAENGCGVARTRIVPFACGRSRADTAPTCYAAMSALTASPQRKQQTVDTIGYWNSAASKIAGEKIPPVRQSTAQVVVNGDGLRLQ